MPLGVIVDVEALAETALAALIAGIAVTFAFSLAIWGLTRFADLRDEGRGPESIVAGLVGGVGLLVFVASIVGGLIVMVS